MPNPYSNHNVYTALLIVAGVAVNMGALPAGSVGGAILEVTISTQTGAAALAQTSAVVSMGGGAPAVVMSDHLISNGAAANATWVVYTERFDGPGSVGLEIVNGQINIWAVSGSPNTYIKVGVTWSNP